MWRACAGTLAGTASRSPPGRCSPVRWFGRSTGPCAKPGGKITIGEVARVIVGRLAPIGCVSQTAYEKCTCPDEVHCGLRMLMLDVRNAIAGILDRYSLADVVEGT